jgi:hypothetical protein
VAYSGGFSLAYDVFISYSSKDKNVADAVCHGLESRKIRCWIAPRDVQPGMQFEDAIFKAIEESKLFVLIYTGNSNSSLHVENELRIAWKKGMPIIPFRLEDIQPNHVIDYYISSRHWLDAIDPPLENNIRKLADTIIPFIKPVTPEENMPESSRGPVQTARPGKAGIVAALIGIVVVTGIVIISALVLINALQHNTGVNNPPTPTVPVTENKPTPTPTTSVTQTTPGPTINTALAASLVAEYHFDGTADDSGGNGYDGVIKGATFVDGVSGRAASFDGKDDFISYERYDNSTTNTFSLELWAYPLAQEYVDTQTNHGESGTYVSPRFAIMPRWGDVWGSNDAGAGVAIGTNCICVYEHAGGYLPPVLVWQGAVSGWTHVIVVYKDRQPSLYVNGKLVAIGLTGQKAFVHPGFNLIGGFTYGYYAGYLDEVRLYNRALTDDEIKSRYNVFQK